MIIGLEVTEFPDMQTNFFFRVLFAVFLLLGCAQNLNANDAPLSATDKSAIKKLMADLKTIGNRLHWNPVLWNEEGWKVGGRSVEGRPLLYYVCGNSNGANTNASLVFSAVHGDEVTPIYWGFRMVYFLRQEPGQCRGKQIVVAPFVNPDGFFKTKTTRTNADGVDLNRNFATRDFAEKAVYSWKTKLGSDKRRFPGYKAASEPETVFQQDLILKFKPSRILSVHAPLNFLDYDGPDMVNESQLGREYIASVKKLKTAVIRATPHYKFVPYGFFPGSLGNYAGVERGIPTFTLELPSIDSARAKRYFDGLKPGTMAFLNESVKENPLQAAQGP